MELVHVYENLVTDVLNEGMKMCEILQANALLEKFPPIWNNYRNQLKHQKRDLSFQELISHIHTGGEIQKGKAIWGKPGHKAYQCKKLKDQQTINQRHVTPQANLVENDEIIAAVLVETNMVEDKGAWIMDSGASRHLCNNRGLFHDFEEVKDGERVFMGNSQTSGVLGKGKVRLKFTSGKTLALNNVLYVPSLRRNMVSGSLLLRAGLKIVLEGDKVVITRNNDFVVKG
ncbi:hypothetical protein Tco_0054672, partial [Tanacetum coccineum]